MAIECCVHKNRAPMIGKKFGRLTVISFSNANKLGALSWNCICECGNQTVALGPQLRSGHSSSCGCLKRDVLRMRMITHGQSKTAEFNIWKTMIQRCHNPKCKAFKDYGGRGITVCPEWISNAARFLADMGPRPDANYSIHRIDNDKGYSKENCRWATKTEQQNGMRSNVVLEMNGMKMTAPEWGRKLGVRSHIIRNRIRSGWTVERTLTEPVKK